MRKRLVVTVRVRERGTIGPGIWQGGSFVSMGLRRLPWPAIRQGPRQNALRHDYERRPLLVKGLVAGFPSALGLRTRNRR